jgi:hypothetical protein
MCFVLNELNELNESPRMYVFIMYNEENAFSP